MLFNSVHFLVFLPLVLVLYYLTKAKYRWVFLLLASYYFYASWRIEYLGLIIFSTLIDYWCALKMSKHEARKQRRPFLVLSLLSNLGLLAFFKYYSFANESLMQLFSYADIGYKYYRFEDLLLPVGISFYTFQTLSYSIEVYRGEQKAERHLGIFALYVSFFPQLVAGPIERFARLGTQLKQQVSFSWSNIRKGLQLMLYGFFAKVCIADNFANIVTPFFENPLDYSVFSAWAAALAYAFQIYCDFFAYSTIAIGLARMLGISIMDNFKSPYFALSITEFWRRWHISLSTWFRDYLYIPLGGNKGSKMLWIRNILIVFLVSGLWHGANWTFVVWGGIHGLIYLLEKFYTPKIQGPIKFFMWLKTFSMVVLAWVFFRAQNFDNASEAFQALFGAGGTNQVELKTASVLLFGLFALSDYFLFNQRFDTWIDNRKAPLRWSVYLVLLACIFMFGGVENHPFIYFQF